MLFSAQVPHKDWWADREDVGQHAAAPGGQAGAGDGEDTLQAGHLWRGEHDGLHAWFCGKCS